MSKNLFFISAILLSIAFSASYAQGNPLEGVGLLSMPQDFPPVNDEPIIDITNPSKYLKDAADFAQPTTQTRPVTSDNQLQAANIINIPNPTRIPEVIVHEIDHSKEPGFDTIDAKKMEESVDGLISTGNDAAAAINSEAAKNAQEAAATVADAGADIKSSVPDNIINSIPPILPIPTPTAAIDPTQPPKKVEEIIEKPAQAPVIAPVDPAIVPKDQSVVAETEDEAEPPVYKKRFFWQFVVVGILVVCILGLIALACHYQYSMEKYRMAPFTPPTWCPNFLFPTRGLEGRGYVSNYTDVEIGDYKAPELRYA